MWRLRKPSQPEYWLGLGGVAVGRLRYSLTEARAEATRRAEAFVADRHDREQWRLRGASPNPLVLPSRASKHPVAWLILFAPVPAEGVVIDGGELSVAVDLEAGTVSIGPWWPSAFVTRSTPEHP